MQTEARPYTPYDPTARSSKLPWLILGAAAAVALLVWFGRRETPHAAPQLLTSGNLATQTAEAKAMPLIEPLNGKAPAQLARPIERGPNVLGAATSPAGSVSLVPATEVERQKTRARLAEVTVASYRKRLASLERANAELGRQLAAVHEARRPPPPSQTEQILQSLAPALRGADER